jgi:hypothetical protein
MSAQEEDWQAILNGRVYTADLATLQQWAGEGRVKATDRVKKGNLSWISAAHAPGLREMFSGKPSVPLSVSLPETLPVSPPVQTGTSQYACRQCGSEHTTSLPMAFSSGVSRGNVQAASWTPDLGVTFTGGQTTSQTDLSRNLKWIREKRLTIVADGTGAIVQEVREIESAGLRFRVVNVRIAEGRHRGKHGWLLKKWVKLPY